MCFSLETLMYHKDWLTYSVGTDRPSEFCYDLFISNDLTKMVHFPTQISDCVWSFGFIYIFLY